MSDLQAAIDASDTGDQVWVATGSYAPTQLIKDNKATSRAFILKDGVSLYGGFAGGETSIDQRVAGTKGYDMANATVLDSNDGVADEWVREFAAGTTYRWTWVTGSDNNVTGTKNNYSHVIYAASTLTQPTVVDGFTLRGGNANIWQAKAAGGAVYAPGTITLRNCRLEENSSYFTAEATDCNAYGGAVYLDGGTMDHCRVWRAYAHSSYGNGYGGGVFARQSVITNCDFEDCVGLDGGGAVYLQGGQMSDCSFRGCYSSAGGAVLNNGGTVRNLDIADCRGLNGGALYNNGSATNILARACYADATEYGETGGGKGGALYLRSGDVAGLCAFNNTSNLGGGVFIENGRVINATIQNNAARTADANISGATDASVLNSIYATDVAPANFVLPTTFTGFPADAAQIELAMSADWQLAPGSSFIDSGVAVDGFTSGLDLAGNPRMSGTAIDCGAYESTGDTRVPTVTLTFAAGTESVRIAAGGATGYEFTIDWGDGVEVSYDAQAYYSHALAGNVVKIYGDDLVVVRAVEQGLIGADVSRASHLQQIMFGGNGMTSLVLGQHPSMTGLYAERNALTSIDVSGCPALRVLDVHENMIAGTIDCSAMTALSKADVADNALTSFVLPKQSIVYDVDCSRNALTALDVTGLDGLESLAASENQLTELALTGLTAATEIYLDGNQLTQIDLAPCTSLEKIMLAENNLTAVNLAVCPSLSGVYLQDNDITALDITANPSIRWINVNNNRLQTLDVSAQTYLSILNAAGNSLTAIDLTGKASLSSLDVSGNSLTSINLTSSGYLSQCHVENNALTALDLSGNPYLYGLFCGGNALTTLDLSHNTYLQRLEAQGNNLTALDLTVNTGLQEVLVQSNNMDSAAIDALIAAIPDVNQVNVTPETTFLRQLNISHMPGTSLADTAPALAKGWYVTADFDAPIEITPISLNIQINREGDEVTEVCPATIEWGNDDHTMLYLQDFMGTSARIVASIDADGNVKIAPQVAGGDGTGNYLMIVNEESQNGNPMAIYATHVAGHFDGTTLTLDPWNFIIVPYTFNDNLGTVYTTCQTSEFVMGNGTMNYTYSYGDTRSNAIYSVAETDGSISVYGWAEIGYIRFLHDGARWTADTTHPALTIDGTPYAIAAADGTTLTGTPGADMRSLTFGAWNLASASGYNLRSGANATLTFNFELPSQGVGVDLLGIEPISVTYTDASGKVSDRPFRGFNIVTRRYDDGHTVSTRVMMTR